MGIDLLEIYMEVAEHFGIDDEALVQAGAEIDYDPTIRDLIDHVIATAQSQNTNPPVALPARSEIQETVIAIISRVTGHSESEFSPGTRIKNLCD